LVYGFGSAEQGCFFEVCLGLDNIDEPVKLVVNNTVSKSAVLIFKRGEVFIDVGLRYCELIRDADELVGSAEAGTVLLFVVFLVGVELRVGQT
jgi:hypothetical protein